MLVECEDYADSITAERVRRVIRGVPSAKDPNLRAGFGGSFSYFELGAPMQQESLLSGRDLPAYEPDGERIKDLALTLDYARSLPKPKGANRLVFAPTKYLDQEFLDRYRITFCQLPFQIYQAIDALTDGAAQHGS